MSAPAAPVPNTSATREMRSELWKENLRDYGLLLSLLLIVAFFYYLTIDPDSGVAALLQPVNITNIIAQNSYVIIMALGMLMVIVGGNIDLSVGAIVGFVGAVAGSLMVYAKWPYPIVMVLSLAIGAGIGAAQGILVAYARIPSFIVTLGGMLIFRGLTGNLLLGQFVGPFARGFQDIASGFVFPSLSVTLGPIPYLLDAPSPVNVVALGLGIVGALAMFFLSLRTWMRARADKIEAEPLPLLLFKNLVFAAIILFISWKLARYKGLPIVLFIMAALTLFYGFITTRTVIGRRIYALGGNRLAAQLSGVKTERLIFLTFANMGLLAGLAGLVVAARLNSSTPSAGNSFELDVIAACFIGGVSASGGVGKVLNVVIGALFMGVMNNGMSLIGLGIFWQQVVKGLVLLAAVGVDVYQKRKG
jgi:putative multiple sugar transport system permease protein